MSTTSTNYSTNIIQKDELHLNATLAIFSSINNIEQLIQTFSFILSEQLHIIRFALFVREDQQWNLLVNHGIKRRLCQIDVIKELQRIENITFIADSTCNTLAKFDWVIPISLQQEPLAYLLIQKHSVSENTNEINFIQTLCRLLVVAIDNQRIAKKQIEQDRIVRELQLAREMQKLLFPTNLPSNKWIDLSAKYVSKYEVGGDYYDFIPIGERDFFMCIGDVSGKGISAAMLMANFQANLRALFLYENYDLRFIIAQLNKKIIESIQGEKFISCFIAHFNAHTRILKYVNAGHNHPILTNGRELHMLKVGSIGLGIFEELPFIDIGEIFIPPNTCIISYTDGVIELENTNNLQFGLDRLIDNIHQFYTLSMSELNETIFKKLYQWKGERPLVDDTALFACKIF